MFESVLPVDAQKLDRRFGAAVDVQFFVDLLEVPTHGIGGQGKLSGNFLVGIAAGKVVQNLQLAPRQVGLGGDLAFQAVDDLLGIWGSTEVTGKPTSSDLRQSKKSLPICGALEGGGPGRDELATLLADFRQREPREAELARAVHLIESGGGRERTETYASDHLRDALDILGDLPIAPAAHDAFADLARFLGRRDH